MMETKHKWLAVGGLLLLAVVALVYHHTRKVHVRFVLPDGFRGWVVLIDSPDATEPAWAGDTCVLEVPEDGILVVSDLSFLKDWHTGEAVFKSGAKVPEYDEEESKKDSSRVNFFPKGTNGMLSFYFLGTEREFNETKGRPWPKLKLDVPAPPLQGATSQL